MYIELYIENVLIISLQAHPLLTLPQFTALTNTYLTQITNVYIPLHINSGLHS